MPYVTTVERFSQITEVSLQSSFKTEKIHVLCDSACSNSRISENMRRKLNVQGTPLKFTVHGINSHQTIVTPIVELKLTPVRLGGSCPPFVVKPYVRKTLTFRTKVNDVESLKVEYPHLQPIPLKKHIYGDVEMILGQDTFPCIHPLEYSETDRKNTPIAVRLPLGWVLSGPLPSNWCLFWTCFKAVTQREADSKLVDQNRSWYDIESNGAYKQVDPCSAADARAEKILQETIYHDGSRYNVGMLRADDQISLPKNYFSALIRFKSLDVALGKIWI